ncbi:hypothetical protein SLEP1_g58263 [Rubroshorea leprosula]|uniref:Uncharacterized protein n=1 Tax=Rubroshorea leprosula TaxID=152421 RepID=A0AAV5MQA8_9ROSI|nr:hypothetical protein SLEP1_g58263 [Rubroshorea leprosula]
MGLRMNLKYTDFKPFKYLGKLHVFYLNSITFYLGKNNSDIEFKVLKFNYIV